jgi:hypothetical protein
MTRKTARREIFLANAKATHARRKAERLERQTRDSEQGVEQGRCLTYDVY